MTITINGTSGITLPSGSTAVGTSDSQSLTNKTIGSGYAGSVLTSGTAVASTSGTSIDFTSIPSWVKRITVMFNGVSTSGTSGLRVQLGNSGGIETTGYTGSQTRLGASGLTSAVIASGFDVNPFNAAADTASGIATICTLGSNIWTCSINTGSTNTTATTLAGGVKTLSGTLDRVRITTVNGTDTFDAGSINIIYE